MSNETDNRPVGASLLSPVPDRAELAQIAIAAGQDVQLVGDRDDGRGPLPIRRIRRRVAGVTVDAAVIAGCDFYDYVAEIDGTDVRALLAAVKAGAFRDVDIIILEQAVGDCVPALRARQSQHFQAQRITAPQGDFAQEFFGAHRRVAKRIRAAQRKLGMTVEVIVEEDKIRKLLPPMAALHVERWGFDGVESAFRNPLRIRQYEVAASSAMMTRMMVGDEIFAIHYGPVFDGVLLWHTPVINVAYLEFSPLVLLLGCVAETCGRYGIVEIDMGLGDEDYKSRFATASRDVREFMIPLSLRGHAAAAVRKRMNAELLRAGGEGAIRCARRMRDFTRRRMNRMRYFNSATTGEGPENGYREVENWPELVQLLRRSGLEITRFQFDRIESGQRFVCLEQTGQVVSYGWLWNKDEPFVVGETGEKIAPGSTVLFDFVTPEPHRGKGHYTRLLRSIAAARPHEPLHIFALTGNKASIAGILRAGYVEYRP
jgi:CelD/BcsL family acetyltransferase involved in cellulose biosynthesis